MSSQELVLEPLGEAGSEYPAANELARGLERRYVIDIQLRQLALDPGCQLVLCQEIPERLRGCRKTIRHAHAQVGEVAEHLSERGILATDALDVAHAQL